MGDIRPVVEGELEVFRAVIHQMVGEHVAIVEDGLPPIVQLEVVIQPLVGAVQDDLIIVVVLVAEYQFHGD